ncbi:MAG TPA: pitrilysin family protein, partial [Thermoanaerobaculia bacterium]|nr:pitrilysin family protein [Thermoanaerobaculia bacterium]
MPTHRLSRLFLTALFLSTLPAAAQDLASFAAHTTVHTLANGWTFIIVERPVAPVFSYCTIANVGSAQEVPGITGLAHMFEHMAFKGGPTIGTRDWAGEQKALATLEAAYQAWQAERLAAKPDPQKLETLEAAFRSRQQEAARFVVQGELDDILTREGGVDLNAFTGADETEYYYSLPSNKVELFAFIESERFAHPVFREFYEERDVVQEERRLRYEGSGFGRLVEQFGITAFDAHPYKQPGVGYMSDLRSISITDAEKFFQIYYAPSNLTTAIVGDVQASTLIPILEKYFGRIPARPAPPPLRTVEPPQKAEKTVVLEDPAQPLYLEAYHKPAATDPDEPVWEAIDDVLSNGHTSRLYRSLVRDKKIAVEMQSFSGYPGDRYPNLWAL